SRPLPNAPVDAKVQLGLQNKIIDLRQCDVALAPGPRATNQLQLRGRVDLSTPDAIDGHLKLTADALDLTDYYDALAGDGQTKTASATTTQPAPPPSGKNPPATPPGRLPFRNFTVDATVGRLYLREVEVTNFQTVASVKGSKATMDPMAFALNGAAVKATANVDLGVP